MRHVHHQDLHRRFRYSGLREIRHDFVQPIEQLGNRMTALSLTSVYAVQIRLCPVLFSLSLSWPPEPWPGQVDAMLLAELPVFPVPVDHIRQDRFRPVPRTFAVPLRCLHQTGLFIEVAIGLFFDKREAVHH